MFSSLLKSALDCWTPMRRYVRMNRDDDDDSNDGAGSAGCTYPWSRHLDKHAYGDLSFSVVQANETIEDHSQIEIGNDAVFVGVYDGHAGPDASRFISDHLFDHLIRFAKEDGYISEETLRRAFSATEEAFLTLVRSSHGTNPLIAAAGSCCLVGFISKGTLYVANLGDSRAVMGCLGRSNKIVAEQLTKDHNAAVEGIRQELKSLHPDDSDIVVLRNGVWRVKGLIQVSRSIGDAYLKKQEFALDASYPRFHLSEPLRRPVLTAEPSVCTRILRPDDKFLIFASDGLWEYLTNQQAVEIVYNHPRPGIANTLVRTALNAAATKRGMRYDDLKKLDKGARRSFHDDITVVVVFIDHGMVSTEEFVPEVSIRGLVDMVGPSKFRILRETNANPET